MNSYCLATTHRVLKTVRISMELVSIMMELWPNLKVIHLVRDPRGITNSRLQSVADFTMSQHVRLHSRDLCTRMHDDVIYDINLQKQYSNRLKIIFYEALADRPLDGAKFIYRFLNISFTEDTFAWVNHSTNTTKSGDMNYYGTFRFNSSKHAYEWRESLDLQIVQSIDSFCVSVYRLLGYVPTNYTQALTSFTIPSRRIIQTVDGFV